MMKKIKIQNLLLPEVGVCTEVALFYRPKDEEKVEWDIGRGQLVFNTRRAKCDFSTYFNGLSIAKWKKYTCTGDISLCLLLKGKFEVILENHYKVKNHLSHIVVDAMQVEGNGIDPIELPYILYDFKGMLSFSLVSLEKGAVFLGGWYETAVDEANIQNVNLAVNICTFKREPFVKRNLALLNRNILKNPDHELYNHLHIFISDNGKTLPVQDLVSDKIHIVPNKNVGGAGGFSRGMTEILKCQEDYPATHVIMMDDDVVIETESLLRTYNMLRLSKEKYRDMFIGGAMLRLDQPQIQAESGASWNAGNLIPNKCGLNLSTLDACLYNETEEYTEYNAWWYCCTPITVIKADNLPLPIFIRGDDLEYGLRNIKTLVLMNGICVWHEPFENKYSSFLQYYILRNLLYDNALHFPAYSKWQLLQRLYRDAEYHLLRYRYRDLELMIQGIRDYYKGVDFLLTTDGEQLHKQVMAYGYKAVPTEELPYRFLYPDYDYSMIETEGRLHRLIRRLTLNGIILPAHKQVGKQAKCVSMATSRPINYYRQRNIINYDAASGKAFVTSKSYRQLFRCLVQLMRVSAQTMFCFDRAKKDFRENSWKLKTAEFWDAYLAD